MDKKILLSYGSGGRLMRSLIKDVFLKYFKGDILKNLDDSAILENISEKYNISFTTDSYIVNPLVFLGGDIGKLSVCGTVNDISVTGASPLFMSCSIIVEEGFETSVLQKVTSSISKTAAQAGVEIVTGDFKVVEKGKADSLFINTSAIGISDKNIRLGKKRINIGDRVIINGYIGDHELAVLLARKEFNIQADIASDCAALNGLIGDILQKTGSIKFMRDPTRGGVATTLNEIVENSSFGIRLYEKEIPVSQQTKALCEMLGFDPLYLANEGKVIVICENKSAEDILSVMKKHRYGKHSKIIGEVVKDPPGKVILNTVGGSYRVVEMLSGSQLPRIC